ncbi:MAG: ABC transporter permease [Solirubrobacteraceae bacterium]
MSTGGLTLRRVGGPSAIDAGDWRRFWRLTWIIAKKDYKLTYFGSVLGYVWSLMQPLLFFGVLYLVFAVIVDFNKGVPDFPVLLLMNIVLFGFFQGGTGASIASVVVRENLVRKMHFPRLVIPVSTVVTQSINLVFNLGVVVCFMLAYGVRPRWSWFGLILVVTALFVFTTGLAMLLSSLYVRYRDISPIWGVVSQAMYFASPVFILIESILPHGQMVTRLYLFNPLATMLQQARHWMIGGPGGGSSPAALMGGSVWLLAPAGIAVAVFVIGFWVFCREAPRIAEEL